MTRLTDDQLAELRRVIKAEHEARTLLALFSESYQHRFSAADAKDVLRSSATAALPALLDDLAEARRQRDEFVIRVMKVPENFAGLVREDVHEAAGDQARELALREALSCATSIVDGEYDAAEQAIANCIANDIRALIEREPSNGNP